MIEKTLRDRSFSHYFHPSGAVAQLIERCIRIAEVRGLNPLSSTNHCMFDELQKLGDEQEESECTKTLREMAMDYVVGGCRTGARDRALDILEDREKGRLGFESLFEPISD